MAVYRLNNWTGKMEECPCCKPKKERKFFTISEVDDIIADREKQGQIKALNELSLFIENLIGRIDIDPDLISANKVLEYIKKLKRS